MVASTLIPLGCDPLPALPEYTVLCKYCWFVSSLWGDYQFCVCLISRIAEGKTGTEDKRRLMLPSAHRFKGGGEPAMYPYGMRKREAAQIELLLAGITARHAVLNLIAGFAGWDWSCPIHIYTGLSRPISHIESHTAKHERHSTGKYCAKLSLASLVYGDHAPYQPLGYGFIACKQTISDLSICRGDLHWQPSIDLDIQPAEFSCKFKLFQ